MLNKNRVLVAMSGGVDSSTVALYDDDRYSSYNIIVT